MARIDTSREEMSLDKTILQPGWYFVGYVTHASVAIMPPGVNHEVGKPLSNTKPLKTAAAARKRAQQHLLRDITVHRAL